VNASANTVAIGRRGEPQPVDRVYSTASHTLTTDQGPQSNHYRFDLVDEIDLPTVEEEEA